MIKAYAAFEQGGEIKPFEYDPGELGRQDVEIDVENCGICHSDLSMLENAWGMSQYPLVAGLQLSHVLAHLGDGPDHLVAGHQRVLAHPGAHWP